MNKERSSELIQLNKNSSVNHCLFTWNFENFTLIILKKHQRGEFTPFKFF